MKFKQARNYTKGRARPLRLIVLHTMETPERLDMAEAVAGWFAGPNAPRASAHYCVDADSVVQCVKDEDTAWHVRGGDVNARSIGIEMAGRAGQKAKDWEDAFSTKMLELVAKLVAELCAKHCIPFEYIKPEDLTLAATSGVTTHVNVTKAYRVSGGHVDPGPDFPMDRFLRMVESYAVYPDPEPEPEETT